MITEYGIYITGTIIIRIHHDQNPSFVYSIFVAFRLILRNSKADQAADQSAGSGSNRCPC
ncbi:hypothetical protein D3C71_2167430 [compost metagenome]